MVKKSVQELIEESRTTVISATFPPDMMIKILLGLVFDKKNIEGFMYKTSRSGFWQKKEAVNILKEVEREHKFKFRNVVIVYEDLDKTHDILQSLTTNHKIQSMFASGVPYGIGQKVTFTETSQELLFAEPELIN